ncbi:MAG: hypothetical protein HFE44_07950 [Oscillospiraceae bacterium]|nr:hypothetical protein [Oscillospiraceae bacterium]
MIFTIGSLLLSRVKIYPKNSGFPSMESCTAFPSRMSSAESQTAEKVSFPGVPFRLSS